jgi:hypothetical protein
MGFYEAVDAAQFIGSAHPFAEYDRVEHGMSHVNGMVRKTRQTTVLGTR